MTVKDRVKLRISCDPNLLVSLINEVAYEKSFLGEEVRDFILSASFEKKYEMSKLSNDDLLKAILLCLAYTSINPDLRGTEIFSNLQGAVFNAAASLGLDSNLIAPVALQEVELYSLLDRA